MRKLVSQVLFIAAFMVVSVGVQAQSSTQVKEGKKIDKPQNSLVESTNIKRSVTLSDVVVEKPSNDIEPKTMSTKERTPEEQWNRLSADKKALVRKNPSKHPHFSKFIKN